MEEQKTATIDYGDGIYGLEQQMVRSFLLVGTRAALLIDTGAVRDDLKAEIKKVTDLPLTVILTHSDGDHIANVQDFPGTLICEKDMAAVLSHPDCRDAALSPLREGQILDLGGRRLKVLFTPGHTAGSVSLLDEDNKLLFSGDSVSYGPVFMFGARRNMTEYLRSLHALKKLKDSGAFDTVYCCHNTCPISPDTVDELIACVGGILDKTITGVPAPMPFPADDKPLLAKHGECMVLY